MAKATPTARRVADLPADISERLNNFWNSQVAANERLQQFHELINMENQGKPLGDMLFGEVIRALVAITPSSTPHRMGL